MSVSQVAAYYPATAVGTMPTSRSPTPSRPFSYPEYGQPPHTPTGHAHDTHDLHDLHDLHDTQGSVVSAVSSTFSAPWLPSSSSTLSTSTVPEGDSTSTRPAHIAPVHSKLSEEARLASPPDARPGFAQPEPPRLDAAPDAPPTGDTAAGSNPLASPVTQGSKRKADEPLMVPTAAMDTPVARVFAHKRNKSMDVHSGSRIGELSAQLKARLSYAMVKVQNGWEKQSLDELEEVHSQRGSPSSAPERGDRLTFGSPYLSHCRRRPSGVSDHSDQIIMSPASDPTRSYAITPPAYWRPSSKPAIHAATNLISITDTHSNSHIPTHHGLAPAPEFQHNNRRRRSSVSLPPPPLLGSSQRKHYSDLGAGPTMPATPRTGILRMPSQQAEKDAVDTLLFMSSPNNSQRYPPVGHMAQSPLRGEAPPRRVMFEAYPPQERHIVYQQQIAEPSHHHHHGSYAMNGAR